jgi:hypothetical protein
MTMAAAVCADGRRAQNARNGRKYSERLARGLLQRARLVSCPRETPGIAVVCTSALECLSARGTVTRRYVITPADVQSLRRQGHVQVLSTHRTVTPHALLTDWAD